MANKAKIGVLGASGYTGGELVRMLLRHPRAEIALLTAERSAGKAMRDVFPHFSTKGPAGRRRPRPRSFSPPSDKKGRPLPGRFA